MSRTEDLRQKGGRERHGIGGGGGAPFVKWGDEYAWIEGKILDTWEGQHGLVATVDITQTGGAGLQAHGKSDEGEDYKVHVASNETVNVGLNSASLQGKITADDKGKVFHVAFEGWGKSKGGNKYRAFSVIELTEREPAPTPSDRDDDLPF